MCGRYSFEESERFYQRYKIANTQLRLQSHYNIAPGTLQPVVVQHSPNSVEIMYWGLIPHWAKSPSQGMINARAETVAVKPWFKKPLQFSRCLIPATGFYEWQKTADGKVPYNIKLKDSDYFSFAGLYDTWKNPETSEEVKTYTIITTEANTLMAPIHNRMPVILEKVEEDYWLNPDNVEIEPLIKLLKPYPTERMEAYPVSNRVNVPKFDDPQLLKPREEPVPKQTSLDFNSK